MASRRLKKTLFGLLGFTAFLTLYIFTFTLDADSSLYRVLREQVVVSTNLPNAQRSLRKMCCAIERVVVLSSGAGGFEAKHLKQHAFGAYDLSVWPVVNGLLVADEDSLYKEMDYVGMSKDMFPVILNSTLQEITEHLHLLRDADSTTPSLPHDPIEKTYRVPSLDYVLDYTRSAPSPDEYIRRHNSSRHRPHSGELNNSTFDDLVGSIPQDNKAGGGEDGEQPDDNTVNVLLEPVPLAVLTFEVKPGFAASPNATLRLLAAKLREHQVDLSQIVIRVMLNPYQLATSVESVDPSHIPPNTLYIQPAVVRALVPGVRVACATLQHISLNIQLLQAHLRQCDIFSPPSDIHSDYMVAANALNITAMPVMVNSPSELERLLHYDVKYVSSRDPLSLLEELQRWRRTCKHYTKNC